MCFRLIELNGLLRITNGIPISYGWKPEGYSQHRG